MTTDRTSTDPDHLAGRSLPSSGKIGGAAIHPRFLRSGPWALSSVVALLFGLSFATSYAALYDYALELHFPREFAIAFPLVLDAVIVVLAVTLLLERALGRRTITFKGWQFTARLPTWPLLALWGYFAGSVAGNVGHAPPLLAAQLVAAVPPVSAALTFHLLLRLLDRAPSLRAIAEAYEELGVDERERAAARKARRDRIKTATRPHAASAHPDGRPASTGSQASGNAAQRSLAAGHRPTPDSARGGSVPTLRPATATTQPQPATNHSTHMNAVELDELRRRVRAAIENGEPVTGETVGQWLGLSARTGRRRLAALLDRDPSLAQAISEG
jgi:predicted DNA-binding transcriptional regulator